MRAGVSTRSPVRFQSRNPLDFAVNLEGVVDRSRPRNRCLMDFLVTLAIPRSACHAEGRAFESVRVPRTVLGGLPSTLPVSSGLGRPDVAGQDVGQIERSGLLELRVAA
jgi:hypothetical protein